MLDDERFLPCQTPVGPSRCLHPGSHHDAATLACTHPGCACDFFQLPRERVTPVLSHETVETYLARLLDAIADPRDRAPVHGACAAVGIPTRAAASDWHPMLGRAFPEYAVLFAEEQPR